MREERIRWGALPSGGNTPDIGSVDSGGASPQPASVSNPSGFAVGDTIRSGNSPEPGTIVSVDEAQATVGVKWRDVGGAIIYPLDAAYLRKVFPWE